MTEVLTYQYRVKGTASCRRLDRLSLSVNQVWNFCNATSFKAIRDYSDWLTGYDLSSLSKGCSKDLGIHSQTIQAVAEEYALKRNFFKKRKLKWRKSLGPKRSLGWIPFKSQSIKIENNTATYFGNCYSFWKSRNFKGVVKGGSFHQNSKGQWFINIAVSSEKTNSEFKPLGDVGIDLGLKNTATFSDGEKLENQRFFLKHEKKIASFQMAKKKKQFKNLSLKIKNIRKDFIHKYTSKLMYKYGAFYIGGISSNFLQKFNGKSSQDASTGMFRRMLKYKAIRHHHSVVDVPEFASTITCSVCFEKSGPNGLSGLGIREWDCLNCKTVHDRDINAAKNILRVGRDSLRSAS